MERNVKMRLVTEKISFINNNLPDGQFVLSPNVTRATGKISDTEYFTQLSVKVGTSQNDKFPVDMEVVLKGIFIITEGSEAEIKDFLLNQAVELVYPYLRTMLTNLTSIAFMPPIYLPIINPRTFFDKKA